MKTSIFRKYFLSIAAICLVLAGCVPGQASSPVPAKLVSPTSAAPTANVIVSQADQGKTVTLKVGQVLLVLLDGNPSTGYSWEVVKGDSPVLEQVGEADVAPQGNMPGSPARIGLRLRAIREGRQALQLIYHRIWEKDVPPLQTLNLTVEVSQ